MALTPQLIGVLVRLASGETSAVLWVTQFRNAKATVDQRLSNPSVNHRPRSTKAESRCVQWDESYAGEVRVVSWSQEEG